MRLVEESTLTAEAWNPESDYLLNAAAAITVTLPEAKGTGHKFRFMVGITATGDKVIQVANSDDVMTGRLVATSDTTGTTGFNHWEAAATSDTITLNGTTKGGYIGDIVELTDIADGVWLVSGSLKQTGTEVTPFSAAV
ncbi:MAG: hypothetical protein KAT62_03655 [Desulfuromonadales bacterium]|nr:hypothetical protein [Desulfuromonadales bacterium]